MAPDLDALVNHRQLLGVQRVLLSAEIRDLASGDA